MAEETASGGEAPSATAIGASSTELRGNNAVIGDCTHDNRSPMAF